MQRDARPGVDEAVKQDLARTFHRALISGDWTTMSRIMAPEVTWTLPGDNQISGTVSGFDAVEELGKLIASYGVTFTLEHVLVSRDNMALGLHNTGEHGGKVLDEHLATVCSITNGKISRIETYLSDVDGMNSYFADRP